jgi:acetylglutamate kinase
MIYAGQINKDIVAQLQANKTNAMGFSGADGNLIQSNKRNHPTIDYGYVGDVQKSQFVITNTLITGITPVFVLLHTIKKDNY